MMKKITGCAVALALAFFASGCGGGSGGGGGGGDVGACGGATQGCVLGTLVDSATGVAVGGATVTTGGSLAAMTTKAAGTTLATANSQGWFSGSGVGEGDVVFCFQAPGYVTTCRTFTVTGTKTTNFPPISMLARAAKLSLADPTIPNTLTDPATGAEVAFGANTLCAADQTTPVAGAVDCWLTPIDSMETAPGEFMGVGTDGTLVPIITGGMMDITCEDAAGEPVNLCSTKTAAVKIPVFGDAATCAGLDATMPMWTFNTGTGRWEEVTGNFTKACGGSATTNVYTGNITHMSWWNADRPGAFTCLTGSVYDATGATANGQATVECALSDAADATATTRARRSVQTGNDGTFCLPIIKSDATVTVNYSCVAKKGQFTSTPVTGTASTTEASCGGDGCTSIGTILLTDPIFRTTLTWNASSSAVPRDLDSHFISTDGSTQIAYFNKDAAVDLNKGSLVASPFIELDTDDTTYEGPENTTVVPGVAAGTYRFCVHNFSADGDMTTSGAKIIVSGSGNDLPRLYDVPTSPAGGFVWQVYEVSIGSDNALTFTDLNKITATMDAMTGCLE